MSRSPSDAPEGQALYEDDFHAWTNRQATLIREGRIDELDLDHLADELDDLSKGICHRLVDELTVLFDHLLKWDHAPEQRTRNWEAATREQRKRIASLLEKNPSLEAKLAEAMLEGYDYGRDRASGETGMSVKSFPETSAHGWTDLMERELHFDDPESSHTNTPGPTV